MDNKLLLIINPNSGDGDAKHWMFDMVSAFSEKYRYITTYLSKGRGDIISTLCECSGEYDAVVCCGGDGTLHEVLNGLVRSGRDIPIGYIPTGTINDFAFSHGIPLNAVQCIENIKNGLDTFFISMLEYDLFYIQWSKVIVDLFILRICHKTPPIPYSGFRTGNMSI